MFCFLFPSELLPEIYRKQIKENLHLNQKSIVMHNIHLFRYYSISKESKSN